MDQRLEMVLLTKMRKILCNVIFPGSRKIMGNFVVFLTLASCMNKIDLEGFDQDNWKIDRFGCEGLRYNMKRVLANSSNQLLGSSQHQILQTFGSPDQRELYEKNQQFFIYLLEPGPKCGADSVKGSVSSFQIRFNAVGQVSEVILKEF